MLKLMLGDFFPFFFFAFDKWWIVSFGTPERRIFCRGVTPVPCRGGCKDFPPMKEGKLPPFCERRLQQNHPLPP